MEITFSQKVRRSIKECDDEIISYAARNKCLAVLGQDSDYVIYRHGAQYYLSSEHLDISKMTTFAYDKFALARHLKLHVKDLPVFASLMGNDHISSDDLKVLLVDFMKTWNVLCFMLACCEEM